ncbi:hypothetical protein CNR22_17900 [Sphingobacteriaceae bacterium]|nr:hypothetical protein CNR22_17900 [Sphingobacteriaceae bacterium]
MKAFFLSLFFSLVVSVNAQIVNAYAKVTAVTNSSVLAVSNVNQTNHTFLAGEKVIVMQMQDDVIGTTGNVSGFGSLGTIDNAGNFELGTILSRNPATGTPTSITLSSVLGNTYNIGANTSVQLITFRDLGTNFTTTSNITGLAWNGNVGGVIGIYVTNTLTLNHSIVADGIGFTGGSRSSDADEACSSGSYRVNDANKGYKGEGIYKRTTANQTNGRARILNGGGGGSENNSGGGGGGNYTGGGGGGYGYQCNSGNTGSGFGGIALSTYISASRLFMGGGGGGGQMNNTNGSNGGNGGGIILLKANTLITNTVCGSAIRISANGSAATNASNDGAGGGGAGGSILLQVNTFSVSSACPLVNSGSGGNGGNVTDGASHGGGGGGGQGVVLYSIPQPTSNITTSVSNGGAGADNSGGSVTAGSGTGVNNAGIVAAGAGPLPIQLVTFSAEKENGKVKLTWSTASETNNAYFTIEKSEDGINYSVVGNIDGAGTSRTYRNYGYYDSKPYSGISYYRLKQTDYSGKYEYSPIVSVRFTETLVFSVFPNPAGIDEPIYITLDKKSGEGGITLALYDLTGKILINKLIITDGERETSVRLDNYGIEKGIYILKLDNGTNSDFRKLIIR